MGAGFVGILTFDIHLPEAGSLKGKRSDLRSLKADLQHRFGAAVAEVDHHDLWQRMLWVQVHGNDKRAERALEGLEAARGLLQQRVNAELHLRRTPVLRFYIDPSLEQGERIEKLIREVEQE